MAHSAHALHCAEALEGIGNHIEDALRLGNKRANFAVLVWVDGTLQFNTNSPLDARIKVVEIYLDILRNDAALPGTARGEKLQ